MQDSIYYAKITGLVYMLHVGLMNMLRLIRYSVLFCTLLLPGLVFAELAGGFGGMASNLMEPVGILSDFVSSVSLIIGVMFLFASILKYSQHRVNPLAVPISTVVFLLVCGIALVLLPLAYKIAYTQPPTSHVEHKS